MQVDLQTRPRRLRLAPLLVLMLGACGSRSGLWNSAGSGSGEAGTGSGGASPSGGGAGAAGAGPSCNGLACGGHCVDATSDPDNCGACGNVCSEPTTSCRNGRCRCQGANVLCGNACVGDDDYNCGACGHTCAADETCAGASCGTEWAAWPMPNPASTGLPNPASYDTSVAGVVKDNVTGLVWQRTIAPGQYAQGAAKYYCASLTLGGKTDWRLPTAIELLSLVDYTEPNPSVDPAAFPDTPRGWYWASTPAVGIDPSIEGWTVGLSGYDSAQRFDTPLFVRCVRGSGPPRPPSHYTVHDGTVKDNYTRLTWQQAVPTSQYGRSEADKYCASLALAGGGWRLPSYKELLTLVDFGLTGTGPAIDPSAFPATPNEQPFWSSSAYAFDPHTSWQVSFATGEATTAYLGNVDVRCVR